MTQHRRPGAGRKPIPNVIKFKTGNPGKRPLKKEPTPEDHDIPTPPVHLDAYALEEWSRVADELHTMGVLYRVDQQILGAYCDAYSVWRHAVEALRARVEKAGGNELAGLIDTTSNGNVVQNTLLGTRNKAREDMVKFAQEFGIGGVARARLAIDPAKNPGSKFDGLIGAKVGKK